MMRRIVRRTGGGLRIVLVIVAAVVILRVLGAVLGLLGGLPAFLLIGGLVLWLSGGARAQLSEWGRARRVRYGLVRGDGLPWSARVELAFWQGISMLLNVIERRSQR